MFHFMLNYNSLISWLIFTLIVPMETVEIIPEPFLVLLRPRTMSVQSGCRTFFVPEPEHAKHFLCSE